MFHIDRSRGSKVLKQVLGETFAGTLGSDYYGAYRKYMREGDVTVQYCMAHLIWEIRHVVIDRHVTQGTCGISPTLPGRLLVGCCAVEDTP